MNSKISNRGKILKRLIWIGLVFFLVHISIICADGLMDDSNPKANVAVILGSKVNTDGSLSKKLKARLDKGLELYENSMVSELYVSGGLGKEGHYEGTVMAEYLISKGVQKKDVKIDNLGINTRNSAMNFVSDYPSESSVILVSQYFHITRCKFAFRQAGLKNTYGAHALHFEWRDPYSLLREFFGFYKYLFFY